MRVAILGAGAKGICMLNAMVQEGIDATVFEAQSVPGGVWTNTEVPYMSLQLASRHYRFPDFPHPKSVDMASASYVQRYMHRYIKHRGLDDYILYNTAVTGLEETGQGVHVTWTDAKTESKRSSDTFDRVICTGQSSIPRIPAEYAAHANVVHTSKLSGKVLNQSKGKTCVVVGGSKSAAEAVYHLREHGAEVTWVARKFYSFAMYHAGTTIDFSTVIPCVPGIVSGKNQDCLFPLVVQDGDELDAGSGNTLVPAEYVALRAATKIQGDVIEVGPRSLTVRPKQKLNEATSDEPITVTCDLVVLATGYELNRCRLTGETKAVAQTVRVIQPDLLPHAMTTFGIINSSLQGAFMRRYLQSAASTSQLFDDFCAQDVNRWRLFLYQMHYLATDNEMADYYDYQVPVGAWLILASTCVVVLLVFLGIIAGVSHAVQAARSKAT